jgi:hypothetical protein
MDRMVLAVFVIFIVHVGLSLATFIAFAAG